MAYLGRMQQPERPPRSDATVVAVGVAAIVLVMIGVGVASYYAGRDHRSTTAAAVRSTPAPAAVSSQVAVAQLTSTIEHGAGVSSNPTRPFMPIWHGVIAKKQIAALVAYMKAGFPAVQYAVPVPVPGNQGDIAAGQALYQRYSCINCHGPK